jgi:hypothetical protein
MHIRASADDASRARACVAAKSWRLCRHRRVGASFAQACGGTLLILGASASQAQVLEPLKPPMAPEWNAIDVFEPLVFPHWWDRGSREGLGPEDRPVRTRQHPGYEAVGIRAASWMFYPSVTLGGLYDSNVFASATDKQSDVALVVAPALRAHTLWERHEVDLLASVRSYSYRQHSGLDQTDASLSGRGRIDIANDKAILTRFEIAHLNVEVGTLTSPAGAVEPTPYNSLLGDVAYRQEFNRLIASIGGRVSSYDYGSTRAKDGAVINQDSRDGQIYVLHGRVDYALSPNFGLFGAAEGNRRDLRGTPVQALASDGYRALGGATVQLTRLISGEIGLGYTSQRFDARDIGTIDGPAYRAMLIWSPTRTIDVWVKAEELVTQVSETSGAGSGVKANAVQVGVDYELLRNLVVSTSGTYETDKFFGQTREDNVYATRAEVKYLPNRFNSISVRHNYIQRDSNVPSLSYDKHEVGIHVTARF